MSGWTGCPRKPRQSGTVVVRAAQVSGSVAAQRLYTNSNAVLRCHDPGRSQREWPDWSARSGTPPRPLKVLLTDNLGQPRAGAARDLYCFARCAARFRLPIHRCEWTGQRVLRLPSSASLSLVTAQAANNRGDVQRERHGFHLDKFSGRFHRPSAVLSAMGRTRSAPKGSLLASAARNIILYHQLRGELASRNGPPVRRVSCFSSEADGFYLPQRSDELTVNLWAWGICGGENRREH